MLYSPALLSLAKTKLVVASPRLPIDPALAQKVDEGAVEQFEGDWLNELADVIETL